VLAPLFEQGRKEGDSVANETRFHYRRFVFVIAPRWTAFKSVYIVENVRSLFAIYSSPSCPAAGHALSFYSIARYYYGKRKACVRTLPSMASLCARQPTWFHERCIFIYKYRLIEFDHVVRAQSRHLQTLSASPESLELILRTRSCFPEIHHLKNLVSPPRIMQDKMPRDHRGETRQNVGTRAERASDARNSNTWENSIGDRVGKIANCARAVRSVSRRGNKMLTLI